MIIRKAKNKASGQASMLRTAAIALHSVAPPLATPHFSFPQAGITRNRKSSADSIVSRCSHGSLTPHCTKSQHGSLSSSREQNWVVFCITHFHAKQRRSSQPSFQSTGSYHENEVSSRSSRKRNQLHLMEGGKE